MSTNSTDMSMSAVKSEKQGWDELMVELEPVFKKAKQRNAQEEPSKTKALVNGIAHTMVTVNDWKASRPFYKALLEHMGLTCVADFEDDTYSKNDGPLLYYVGCRTAFGVMEVKRTNNAKNNEEPMRFQQFGHVGLHHVCFRASSREAVDIMYDHFVRVLMPLGGKIVTPVTQGAWASGYYYFLFEDPDGIRIEINHVPGKGLLHQEKPTLFAKL